MEFCFEEVHSDFQQIPLNENSYSARVMDCYIWSLLEFFGKLKSLVGLEESNFSITSEQLRQIVNEELKSVMKEKQKK